MGIPNEFHSGSQFEPILARNLDIIEEAFIFKTILLNFEDGFLLGPFPALTRFVKWFDPQLNKFVIQQLRFANIFTVPKTKMKQRVGRAVFDLKILGYNLGIPDEDAFVKLPRFADVVALLRGKAYACVINLKNAYRQWATTRASYADFAYFKGSFVWIDTSLVFGIRNGCSVYQTMSTASVLAIVTGHR